MSWPLILPCTKRIIKKPKYPVQATLVGGGGGWWPIAPPPPGYPTGFDFRFTFHFRLDFLVNREVQYKQTTRRRSRLNRSNNSQSNSNNKKSFGNRLMKYVRRPEAVRPKITLRNSRKRLLKSHRPTTCRSWQHSLQRSSVR